MASPFVPENKTRNRSGSQKRLSDDKEDFLPQKKLKQSFEARDKENLPNPHIIKLAISPTASQRKLDSPRQQRALPPPALPSSRLSRSQSFQIPKITIPEMPPSPYCAYKHPGTANARLQRSSSSFTPQPFADLFSQFPPAQPPPSFLDHQQKLPCKKSEKGQNTITAETLSLLLAPNGIEGKYRQLRIFDCRYEYEFEGGHIAGAENWPIVENLLEAVSNQMDQMTLEQGTDICYVIHCEFSSERGPHAYKRIREMDRKRNSDSWGRLFFPEMYILEGGYSVFFEKQRFLCDPQDYVTMRNSNFKDEYQVAQRKVSMGKKWLSRSCPNLFEEMDLEEGGCDSPRTSFAARLSNLHLTEESPCKPTSSPKRPIPSPTKKMGVNRSRSWEGPHLGFNLSVSEPLLFPSHGAESKFGGQSFASSFSSTPQFGLGTSLNNDEPIFPEFIEDNDS